MGLAASQARFLNLTCRLTQVQAKGQFVNNQRTAIANQLNQMMMQDRNSVGKANSYVANGGGETTGYISSGLSKKQGNDYNKSSSSSSSSQSQGIFSSILSSLEGAACSYPGAEKSPMQLDSAKLASLQAEDKRLELILRTLDTQEQALQTEISAVTKVIDKNIEASFKLMA